MPHLVVDISGHGFGHAGQTAPVIAELRDRRPDLHLTIRSRVPDYQLAQLFASPFARAPAPPEIGLLMRSPVEVDRPASRDWYGRLHAAWETVVAREARALMTLAPDLLLSNVGYVGLAAAARAGIPALALSSLNWADVVAAYDAGSPEAVWQMREAYRAAAGFIQIAPHMPMDWLDRRLPVGPVARIGRYRRNELVAHISCRDDDFLALVSFGGIPMPKLLTELPSLPGVVWLVDQAELSGTQNIGDLGWPFIDLVASADLIVTKTSYGLFVEPACHGKPVLYRPRPDWPESAAAEAWIRTTGIGQPLPATAAELAAVIRNLRQSARPAPVLPTGIAEAVAILMRFL